MTDISERIRELEEEIRSTKYNKATQFHIGLLKARIAKLRKEMLKPKGSSSRKGFGIRKSGDATIALIGFPSVGKSTLLNKLTSAESRIGTYSFTTTNVVPGMMRCDGARIQVLDLPGIIEGAASGRGRGKEAMSVARNADMLLIILDVFQARAQFDVLMKELREMGMRPGGHPPKISLTKKKKGGIEVHSTVQLTKLNEKIIKEVLNIYGIHNAEVIFREDVGVGELIDMLAGNRIYPSYLLVLNKCDLVDSDYISDIMKDLGDAIPVSAAMGHNITLLKKRIRHKLNLIKVYMKPKGGEVDFNEPMILKKGATISSICDKIHRKLRKGFKYALVWGRSVRFGGQRVGLNHIVEDGDIITIVSR